jgi:hypothetical protein
MLSTQLTAWQSERQQSLLVALAPGCRLAHAGGFYAGEQCFEISSFCFDETIRSTNFEGASPPAAIARQAVAVVDIPRQELVQ